jgi:hypothetical protein
MDMQPQNERAALQETVRRAVEETPAFDMHTHLFSPGFQGLLLWGIDELLTYHYLVSEVFRYAPMPYETWWALPKKKQAEYIWKNLFVDRTPLSEATRGVLTALKLLGLDAGSRDLDDHRAFFAARTPRQHVDAVLKAANVSGVVMTNDPFDEAERGCWGGPKNPLDDPRFHAALRIDALLIQYRQSAERLQDWGYKAGQATRPGARAEIRRFLTDWVKRVSPVYVAASLSADFTAFDGSDAARIFTECVLPVARAENLPVALMLGVKRQVNPGLRLAGDGVGLCDVSLVERLCADYPENRFLVTMLARENQHALCVAARKFPNLMPFGCWWFMNVPELIREITNMRTELLGLSYIPQHSDARVLDQLVYKWTHSRRLLADVLAQKYADLAETGWRVTPEEVRRDVAGLLGGNFWGFCKG